LAELAGVVGCHERPDDEIADPHVLHLGADLLDDTDVLVPHRRLVHAVGASIRPQVGPADAGRGDLDDGIGRPRDGRLLALFDTDVPRSVHDYSTHVHSF
jgi:hypothetical protein